MTTNRPAAVSISVRIAHGRPWFAYPRPDDFALTTGRVSQSAYREQAGVGDFLVVHENAELETLDDLREGYPWIRPHHRSFAVTGMGWRPQWDYVHAGLLWQSVIVSPQKLPWMRPPHIADQENHGWWERLRDVDCSWVSSRGEADRFLYYDGPTMATSPIMATLDGDQLTTSLQEIAPPKELVGEVHVVAPFPHFDAVDTQGVDGMVIRVDADGVNVATLDVNEHPMNYPLSQITFRGPVKDMLMALLTKRGLTKSETAGLISCWEQQFFQTEGTRFLGVFGRRIYDQLCPIHINPQPAELARVGIVLIEL